MDLLKRAKDEWNQDEQCRISKPFKQRIMAIIAGVSTMLASCLIVDEVPHSQDQSAQAGRARREAEMSGILTQDEYQEVNAELHALFEEWMDLKHNENG